MQRCTTAAPYIAEYTHPPARLHRTVWDTGCTPVRSFLSCQTAGLSGQREVTMNITRLSESGFMLHKLSKSWYLTEPPKLHLDPYFDCTF